MEYNDSNKKAKITKKTIRLETWGHKPDHSGKESERVVNQTEVEPSILKIDKTKC